MKHYVLLQLTFDCEVVYCSWTVHITFWLVINHVLIHYCFTFLYIIPDVHIVDCGAWSVNPITGRWEEPKPSPMEGMTEEQKEYEAMQLVNKLDKLQRSVSGLIFAEV